MNGIHASQMSGNAQNVSLIILTEKEKSQRHFDMPKKKITQEELKKILRYYPKTGRWVWLVTANRNKAHKGSPAGHLSSDGYWYIRIKRKLYKSSRLAFLYMVGYFPEHEAEHINIVRSDDRWINLREATHRCNSLNVKIKKNNKSGVVGVVWDKAKRSWHAQIRVRGKSLWLGRFKDFNQAVIARWEAEKKHGFPNCCTISSAYKYLQGLDEFLGGKLTAKKAEKG